MNARQRKLLAKKKEEQKKVWEQNDMKVASDAREKAAARPKVKKEKN